MDPGGGSVLAGYLKQLEAQQALVRELLANQQALLKSGKVERVGALRPATGKMVCPMARSYCRDCWTPSKIAMVPAST